MLHTTEFWEENYKEFSKDNFKCIHNLISILESFNYKDSIKSIVCFDLGEFARLYPTGA
jgi:V-type H+-transporting ATPase subunit H